MSSRVVMDNVGNNAAPAWALLSDLSIPVLMTYAHALADLYVI